MSDAEPDIISFTPAPGLLWTAHFKDDDNGEEWELPVIGWALVHHDFGPGEGTENKIEPVVLDEDKYPVTMHDYCEDRATGNAFLKLYRGLRARPVDGSEQQNGSAP